MRTTLRIPQGDGQFATFEGANGRGFFSCSDKVPLSIAWHLDGKRFGDIVTIDNPAGKWLARAIIVSADSDHFGTSFELTY